MPESEAHVVIAGLGRFGQIVARVLAAREIPFTALDGDPTQIEMIRRFGGQAWQLTISINRSSRSCPAKFSTIGWMALRTFVQHALAI